MIHKYEENDAKLISNLKTLASGEVKKLKANEANVLLIRLIQAIIIIDDLEETIHSTGTITDTEHESEEDDSEDESKEDGNNQTIAEIPNVDPLEGTSKKHLTNTEKVFPIPVSVNKEISSASK